jgi:hypothetical protein
VAPAEHSTDPLAEIERLLEAQRAALASRDPSELEQVNLTLTGLLNAMRRDPPTGFDGDALRRIRSVLRAQAEHLARGQATVERALNVLLPEAGDAYPPQGSTPQRPGRHHAIA